jgi:hypothetical protein
VAVNGFQLDALESVLLPRFTSFLVFAVYSIIVSILVFSAVFVLCPQLLED